MQTKRGLLSNELTTTSQMIVIMAVVFGLFAILFEIAFNVSLKLPGHRALPGAFTILVFAEAFVPLMLIVFAAIVSSILISLNLGGWSLVLVWLTASVIVIAMNRSRFSRSVFYYVLCGMIFGTLLWISKIPGIHHTPEMIRAGGHMLFGAAGGLFAFGLARKLRRA